MSGLRFKVGDEVVVRGRIQKLDPDDTLFPYSVLPVGAHAHRGDTFWVGTAAVEVPPEPAPDLAQAIADRDAALADRDRWELRARRLGWDRD